MKREITAQEIAENGFDSIWVLELPSLRLEYTNREASEALLGYPVEDFYRDPRFWISVVHEEDRAIAMETMPTCFRDGKAEARYRMVRKDGRVIWVMARLRLLRDPSGTPTHLIGSSLDITKSVQFEEQAEALRKSEALFREIANLSPDIISIIAADGTLTFNSRAAERIHGYKDSDLIGRNTMELIHPDDRPHIMTEFTNLLEQPGNLVNVQYRYLNKDGSYSWMEAVGINQSQNALIKGVITISRDINRRKLLEQELRSAVRTRDEFLSIASHDLKTPLTAMSLQLELLNQLLAKGSQRDLVRAGNLARESVKSSKRIISLLSELLDVTRIRIGKISLKREHVDLKAVIENIVSLMSEEIDRSGSSVTISAKKPVNGNWDPNRIDQIVSNLLSNALKYGAGGPVEIGVAIENNGTGKPRYAKLWIKDRGVGIPLEKQKTVFEAFERATNERRIQGLGLGLYIVREMVEAHGGTIHLESEQGAGSIFTVLLPVNHPLNHDGALQG